jgi:glycolate oxidase FAD binding subunit
VAGRTATTLGLLGPDASTTEETPPWWGGYPWSAGDTALKLTFVRSGLPTVLAAARDAPAPVALRGSAAVGVLYGAIPGHTDAATVAGTIAALRATCQSYGGSLVVIDAPRAVKDTVDVWGPIPALALMRRIKDQFDPEHRLAPGRFVGGI